MHKVFLKKIEIKIKNNLHIIYRNSFEHIEHRSWMFFTRSGIHGHDMQRCICCQMKILKGDKSNDVDLAWDSFLLQKSPFCHLCHFKFVQPLAILTEPTQSITISLGCFTQHWTEAFLYSFLQTSASRFPLRFNLWTVRNQQWRQNSLSGL